MADELTLDCAVSYSKGGVSVAPTLGELLVTVSGTELIHEIQLIGTTEEAIGMPADVATPGYAVFFNRDATNYVSIRRATGEGNMIKLKPGEYAIFRLEATAPYAIANTAACRLEYWIFED